MPLDHLHQRWHFHQRMNKKVWTNLERLKDIAARSQSKQDILDGLHPWRLAINLRFNNTFAILQFVSGILLILIAFLLYASSGGWLVFSCILGLAICTYAYLSIEKQSHIDHVIQLLSDQVYQHQYQVKFLNFPTLQHSAGVMNPAYLLARVRQGFNCLNEGNAGNNIDFYASTTWHVQGHDFPVLLFHYECIDEIIIRDVKGNEIKKKTISHRYGACVFDMPNLGLMVSTQKERYTRYPIQWSTSDIQFNQKFNVAGQQELELARNLTPTRILAIANHLEHMHGTLMFHDQMNAFCYVSRQNIFQTQLPKKPITDVSMLRGYLRTLRAPHYEKMVESLIVIIRTFQDDSLLSQSNKNT